jgi:hypothetical protein
MHLIIVDTLSQGGIDLLMTRDRPHALEGRRYDDGSPVAAITSDLYVFARKTLADDGLDLVSSHGKEEKWASVTDLVAGAKQVQRQKSHHGKRSADDAQTQPG